ncbi:substrate-binding domain-containing protein [Caenispirillum bisanense]|uniref:substrate-binding domain-containing protein n=1 Tax=Caenispirillum bisanense TaxID=414052 RepID=UPI0031D27282
MMVTRALASALVVAATLVVAPSLAVAQQPARDTVRVTGSSTLYGFATRVAEAFGRTSHHRTPVVESSGTGGGFARFCSGLDINTPDIVLASRRVLDSEIDACHDNGVDALTEFKIGYGGLVVVQASSAQPLDLTRRQLWLALAAQVPIDGRLVPNPYRTWRDIGPGLPEVAIRIYGPPPTSGTRDSLIKLVMEAPCEADSYISSLAEADKRRVCAALREDGAYINVGEDDGELIKRVAASPDAAGIVGLHAATEAPGRLTYAAIEGVQPSMESIRDSRYPLFRALYFYLKTDHLGRVAGLKSFVRAFVSDDAVGPDGYLIDAGLIPLAPTELEAMQARAAALPDR